MFEERERGDGRQKGKGHVACRVKSFQPAGHGKGQTRHREGKDPVDLANAEIRGQMRQRFWNEFCIDVRDAEKQVQLGGYPGKEQNRKRPECDLVAAVG